MHKLVALFLLSAYACAASVTGKWNAAVELDIGSGNPTFILKETAGQLTGTYSGALGEAKLTGTVDGDRVQFSFDVSPNGDKITVTYTGTLEGDKKLKGTVKLGDAGGTFTATKD